MKKLFFFLFFSHLSVCWLRRHRLRFRNKVEKEHTTGLASPSSNATRQSFYVKVS